jgi:hypothetical protein
VARDHGAAVAEINLEPTAASFLADWSLFGKAGALLPALVRALIDA